MTCCCYDAIFVIVAKELCTCCGINKHFQLSIFSQFFHLFSANSNPLLLVLGNIRISRSSALLLPGFSNLRWTLLVRPVVKILRLRHWVVSANRRLCKIVTAYSLAFVGLLIWFKNTLTDLSLTYFTIFVVFASLFLCKIAELSRSQPTL